MEKLLIAEEAAEYLGISLSGFYRRCRKGDIKPAKKVMGVNRLRYVFSIKDLEELRKNIRYTGRPEKPFTLDHCIKQTDEMMTTPQAARYLGVAAGTVRDYTRKGKLNPVGRKIGVKGAPHLYLIKDLDKMLSDSEFYNPRTYTKRGRSAFFMKATYPTEDVLHPNGCTIYWSKLIRTSPQNLVPIKCANCKKEFNKGVNHLRQSIAREEFTGCCPNCYKANRKPQRMLSGGRIEKSDGYIYRHKRTFTKAEWNKLEQWRMTREGDYVLEHRVVLAFHLNRAITTDEFVHHLNGKKNDNRVSNLAIYDNSTHSRVHTYQIKIISVLENELDKTTKEVKRLRSLLDLNGIDC